MKRKILVSKTIAQFLLVLLFACLIVFGSIIIENVQAISSSASKSELYYYYIFIWVGITVTTIGVLGFIISVIKLIYLQIMVDSLGTKHKNQPATSLGDGESTIFNANNNLHLAKKLFDDGFMSEEEYNNYRRKMIEGLINK